MTNIAPDEGGPLYAPREKIHPRRVSGAFRTFKWRIMAVTLAVYYLTPWIRWDRGEGQPDQAVLVDLANRRFHFFFVEIWPQEFWFVAGMLVMAGIGLFLITSVVGRAWCGYLCPQTVWTDLFIHVERWIEGDRNARIRLDKQGWSADQLRKRAAKHAIWLLIALLTGGAWVFYFADAPTLLGDLVRLDAPAVAYGSIAVLTFTTYVLGGWMREQVCLYMCPWPRIQGAMLDEKSLTVTYNDWRGEPRGRHRKSAQASALGDCIDCNACVAVCPTGVDIREGQQIGCITCGLCIDACNDVMAKVDLPKLLISYSTLDDYEERRTPELGAALKRSMARPRTALYFLLWAGLGLALVTALTLRDRLTASFEHVRNPPYVILSDGSVRNGFSLKLANKRLETRIFEVSLDGLPGAAMTLGGSDAAPARSVRVTVPADATREAALFVTLPPDADADAPGFTFRVADLFGTDETAYDATLFLPER